MVAMLKKTWAREYMECMQAILMQMEASIRMTKQIPGIISAGKYGYLQSDGDFDGQIDNKDKNDFWFINNGKATQVPN